MIGDNERVLAVIPARGGSKGLPRKNILPLGDKPLIAWTIQAALAVGRIDQVVVSSDDPEIRNVAFHWGCPKVLDRPDELSGDEVPTEPVLLDVAERLEERFEWILLLQPTSPLRQPRDIEAVLDIAAESGGNSIVSVTEAAKSPYWHFTLNDRQELEPMFPGPIRSRRQDQPVAVVPNGAVFLARTNWLAEAGSFYGAAVRAHIMPRERSIDIDSELDLALANVILDQNG